MDGKSKFVGRDSGVNMASDYGMDGPGIETQWGRVFPHPSGLLQEPTQPPVQEIPGLFPGD
jgi:hypothetical protein